MKIKSPNHMVSRQTGDFDEETLVRKCQENDMGAFKVIFQYHSPVMYRTAIRILRNEQDAEDVVQNTFLKVYRNIKAFQFRSKFSTYLYRILINNCYDSLKKKRVPVDSLENDTPGINPLPGQAVELESAIQKLPRRMRTCFILFAIEEFKQEEIARIMNLRLGTVKATIFRAKQNLRRLLTDPAKEGQA